MEAGSEPNPLEARLARAVDALYETLSRNRVTRFPWAVIQTFSKAQGALLSGSMAYYTFLSLMPLLLVSAFVLGQASSANVDLKGRLARALAQIFPAQGYDLVDQLIDVRAALGVLGLVMVSLAGSGFVGALTASLNQMWGVRQGRNPIGQKLLNLLLVLLLAAVLFGSVSLTVWVNYVASSLLDEGTRPVSSAVEVGGSLLSLFLVLLLLYRMLPARRLTWRSQIPGAAFGGISIEILKRLFAFWTQHSAGIGALPRSLLSAVLLLVWLGFFGQLILYGAALNVVVDRRRRGLPLMPDAAAAPATQARP